MNAPDDLPHRRRTRFGDSELEELFQEWRQLGRECLRDAVKERPLETLALAFVAGTVLGALLGRRT